MQKKSYFIRGKFDTLNSDRYLLGRCRAERAWIERDRTGLDGTERDRMGGEVWRAGKMANKRPATKSNSSNYPFLLPLFYVSEHDFIRIHMNLNE